ncbi:hypothetical protein AGOR_G00239500 [Albula goreensis]|uniref:MADF domain-containing protein n=1 Tax=Albula goreensis TaxID=1534307 RepID=A0A8T3CII0_9TELE|nr:hypothetical protein AGOR_G00239500 [Albula goreensis]
MYRVSDDKLRLTVTFQTWFGVYRVIGVAKQPAGSPSMEGKEFWTRPKVEQLCNLWKTKHSLYNIDHEYHDRWQKRRDCIEIAQQLGTTVEELLKKMKNLRSQYARERRKTRFSAVDNCQVSSSKWYLLSVLKFLEKSEVSISVAEDVIEEITNDRLKAGAKEEADSLNWPKNGHMGGPIAEKRARLETEEPGSPRGQTTEDAFDIFGKFVASEIRQMESTHMQKVAKLRIQQVLLDVQMDVVAQASSSSQKHSQQK